TDPATLRGDGQTGFGVGEDCAVERDTAAIRSQQPGDRHDNGRLPASRRAKQPGDPRRWRVEVNVHLQIGKPGAKADGKAHRRSKVWRRGATHSDARKPPIARMIETTESRAAVSSPPGDCSAA